MSFAAGSPHGFGEPERSRLHTEELAGINKAVEILTSNKASSTFGRATSMFFQTSQDSEDAPKDKAVKIPTSDEASSTFGQATSMFLQTSQDAEDAPKSKAYRALKKVARKYRSLRLAALAATVKTAVGGAG